MDIQNKLISKIKNEKHLPFRRFGIYLRDCVEQEEKSMSRHYPCDFVKTTKNRPVDLSDVTESGRRNWPAARNLRFCRTSHEHHTNVTRTFSELWELNHAFPGKRNFYLLLLYR